MKYLHIALGLIIAGVFSCQQSDIKNKGYQLEQSGKVLAIDSLLSHYHSTGMFSGSVLVAE